MNDFINKAIQHYKDQRLKNIETLIETEKRRLIECFGSLDDFEQVTIKNYRLFKIKGSEFLLQYYHDYRTFVLYRDEGFFKSCLSISTNVTNLESLGRALFEAQTPIKE